MSQNNILSFKNQDSEVPNLLTEIARQGAREMLAKAIELEVQDFLGDFESLTTEDGRKRIVCNGYLPEREIQTGIGPLAVQVPRVRDRDPSGSRIDFSSAIIPRYLRRSKSIETLLPLLYLKGISTEDFKSALHEIWMSETKSDANKAFEAFIKTYGTKYPKAVQCLEKDKEELLTFYDYPAEHWKSLRTTNPIESTLSTVRHRTKKVKGCFSRKTILTMVFKLCKSAEKRWHRIAGFKRLGEVITGVKFVEGFASINNDQDTRDAA